MTALIDRRKGPKNVLLAEDYWVHLRRTESVPTTLSIKLEFFVQRGELSRARGRRRPHRVVRPNGVAHHPLFFHNIS